MGEKSNFGRPPRGDQGYASIPPCWKERGAGLRSGAAVVWRSGEVAQLRSGWVAKWRSGEVRRARGEVLPCRFLGQSLSCLWGLRTQFRQPAHVIRTAWEHAFAAPEE